MNPNEYLNNLIKDYPVHKIIPEDEKKIRYEGMSEFIFSKINSTKFKSSAMPKVLRRTVYNNIKTSVNANKPIHISVPFGGYKKWQFPTYPYPDWAEVFNITLMRDYLAHIAAAYKPGILLDYFSDEIFISRMNNYPQKDLDEYNREFKQLLEEMQKYMPENLKLKFSRIRDEISQEEILKRFDKTIIRLKEEWEKLSQQEKDYKIKKAERNYKDDLTKYSDKEKYQKLFDSTMVHDAFIDGEWDKGVPWAFGESMIPVGFRYTGSWGIHLKSSRSSTVQFWIGIGILQQQSDEFIPSILTYNQYLDAKTRLVKKPVDVFDNKFANLGEINILS